MKNKKAFTIIELLGVITILAIILIIAIPKVLSTIEESKKKSFLQSAHGIIRKVNEQKVLKDLTNKIFTITDGEFVGEELDLDGELPIEGTINIDEDGNVGLSMHNNKYCVLKARNSNEITISDYNGICMFTTPESCFTYTIYYSARIYISGYDNSCSKQVVIPNTIEGLPVYYIGVGAFYNKQLTSVVIPEGVVSILPSAFAINQLTSVTIPSSITSIGTNAFNINHLPDDQAFIYARNSDGSKNKTILVSYGGARKENVIIPNTVKTIFENAFHSTQITSVAIPDSVTNIGVAAFSNNQLTSIIIPNSVTSIGKQAFGYNQLESVVLPLYITSINNSVFSGNQLTNITIPQGVYEIQDYAFENNQLTSVTLPSSVTSIGDSAFSNNQLTSVTIPSNVSMSMETISSTFYDSYVTQNSSQAGTYTAPSQTGIWTKQ